jgi:hypothetical protein
MTTSPSSSSFFDLASGCELQCARSHQWRSPSMTQHVTRLAKGVLARDKIPVLRVAQREQSNMMRYELHQWTWT